MMEQMTLEQIARAVGGVCKQDGAVSGVCIDTRKLEKGCLFIAIKGERFDGHDYIRDAFALGAAAALSEREIPGCPVILVKDTKRALLDLARFYRERFPIHLVGVTGSVGKTTTKEMIACVLSAKCKTLKTQGNLNNDIGLPLTLLGLDHTYQAAVIEMGMSGFGEISVLSQTARPNVAVITNIGYSHIEMLGSREGILRAKLEILDGLQENGTLILNADDTLLFNQQDELEREIIYYGIENEAAPVRAVNIQVGEADTRFTIRYFGKQIEAVIPCTGRHNILNALAAFCVGLIGDIPPADIVKAYFNYRPAGMRQNIIQRAGQTLIIDCYNASPTSMAASIDVLADMPCKGRRVAVLGDMLELGAYAGQLHRDIADQAKARGIDLLLCYGEQMAHCKSRADEIGLGGCVYFDSREALAGYIKEELRPEDLVLFKASRGMRMEKVIEEAYGEVAIS